MDGVPLKPPAAYRDDVVRYLRLEFGESDDDPEALKASDLKYVGLYAIDGVPTYYWSYPVSRGKPEYATWEVYANTYCLGMSGDVPDPSSRITDAAHCPSPPALDVPPPRATPWYRRGPLRYAFGVAASFGMIWAMVRFYRRMRTTTSTLSAEPLAEVVPHWVAVMDMKANDSSVALRAGASAEQVAGTEARLGHSLPAAVAEFYRMSDGVEWRNAVGYESLPPLAELRHGGDLTPPLSARLQGYWEEHDRADGEPRFLQVGGDDLKGMLNAEPLLVDFGAVDGMMVLSRPDDANFLAAVMSPVAGLEAGNVLQVEGTRATRYRDLRHWFAGQVAMFRPLQEMQRRAAG